jgi:hypothetical protein
MDVSILIIPTVALAASPITLISGFDLGYQEKAYFTRLIKKNTGRRPRSSARSCGSRWRDGGAMPVNGLRLHRHVAPVLGRPSTFVP